MKIILELLVVAVVVYGMVFLLADTPEEATHYMLLVLIGMVWANGRKQEEK